MTSYYLITPMSLKVSEFAVPSTLTIVKKNGLVLIDGHPVKHVLVSVSK